MLKMLDAQAALGFLIAQTTHIEATMWRKKYPEILYPDLVDVDESANPWTPTVTYFSTDYTGQAEWLHAQSDDFPTVNMSRNKVETEVAMAGIGYEYNLEELSQAHMLNINLPTEMAVASRDLYERKCDGVALLGDTQKGWKGLLNNASVDAADVVDGAGSADTTWPTKTVDEIVADVNEILLDVYLDSNTIELADTLLLPVSRYTFIATKRLDATMTTTILEHIQRVNAYTAQTGKPLKIRAVRHLETAGTSGHKRMVAYKRSPDVVKMHRPAPLTFMPVQGPFGLKYKRPGYFRLGGVDVRRPGAMRYRDYI